jgi:tetratricopeptide (TPR) repeat protein
MDSLNLDLNFKQIGLIKKYLKDDRPMSPEIFKLYSYNRGLYDKYIDYSRITSELVMWYPYSMMWQADELLFKNKPDESIQLYKKAILFPFVDEMKNNESRIYFNMSFAYKYLNDNDNQIVYLKKTIKSQKDYCKAYEVLGMIYYEEKLWPMAKDMFESAIKYGSENKLALQQYINQMGYIDMPAQLEELFNQAVSLLAAGKYLKAMDYFDFLLEYNYKANEIYKNIGVYNFKNNNFEEALKYFQKAEEWDKSAGIYAYIAYTYYKLGQPDKALNTLKEGMQAFGNDQQLVNLYNQIQQAGNIIK